MFGINFEQKFSIVGGTAFGILPNIPLDDLKTTIVMASVGAIVSFIVSSILRILFQVHTRLKDEAKAKEYDQKLQQLVGPDWQNQDF